MSERGLFVEPLDVVALATIIVRPGRDASLDDALRAHFGCALPKMGQVSIGPTASLVWSGPGQWLAVAMAEPAFASLPEALGGIAAVTDQTDSRALVRVSGPRARDTLAKGFAIDFHPSVFAPESAAVTKVAHLSVQIWQIDDVPTYVIAAPRSFAGSFWSWLRASAPNPSNTLSA